MCTWRASFVAKESLESGPICFELERRLKD